MVRDKKEILNDRKTTGGLVSSKELSLLISNGHCPDISRQAKGFKVCRSLFDSSICFNCIITNCMKVAE